MPSVIRLKCPACKKIFKVPNPRSGWNVSCPYCKRRLVIPRSIQVEAGRKPSVIWLFVKRIASPAVLITAIVLAIKEVPGVMDFLRWAFANTGTNGQVTMAAIAGIGLIYFAVLAIKREERVADLKAERDSLEQRLRSKEAELKQVEENSFRLAEEGVKEDIWRRDTVNPPRFVDKDKRNACFISMLNLKGGVGKTTLAANLGSCLALMDRPLKVLLIDLDFQASLSNMSVEAAALITARKMRHTTERLLDPHLTVDDFKQLLVGVNQVANGRILIADDSLESMDFQTQAKFFLKPEHDARFLFRKVLHQREITDYFDVVIFDCPPRLTTSTVNALTTSDYVLIPTKLDERSFEAIPRTLAFLNRLRTIAQPKIIGVIANEVQFWGQKLRKTHMTTAAKLRELIQASDCDLHIFDAMVELSMDVVNPPEKNLVTCVDADIRKELFHAAAVELRERIGK
jgi:cellulose biosynthesis protein BcsQ/DNA-directed RNA polymerase subunit RPC12/RpoP